MLKLDPKLLAAVQASQSKQDLYPVLQTAIELEHSTIPPYLTAYYSLKPGLNDEIAGLIRSVIIEEMLHMTISSNILIALGGHPAINTASFVPDYPGPLPGGVGGPEFSVHIAPFSMDLVLNTFMAIEEPEDPIPIGTLERTGAEDEPATYRTIGEFYAALQAKLAELDDSDFGQLDQQVVGLFAPSDNFLIDSSVAACKAIDVIVDQGEGSSTNPSFQGEPAHYYRFGEIYYGAKLIQTKDGFSYGGEPIAFVSDGVYPMQTDPSAEQFPAGSYGRLLTDNFIIGYSNCLNSLHRAFNGEPAEIKTAIGLMYQLRFLAQKLMSTPLKPGEVATAGPVWRYRNG